METLPKTKTEEAVCLYHRYMDARRTFLHLEMKLQGLLRDPSVNLNEYWKKLYDDDQC